MSTKKLPADEVMKPAVTIGQKVYSYEGQMAFVEAVTDDYIVVSEPYSDPDTGADSLGPLVKWYSWSLTTITAKRKKDEELQALATKIAERRAEVADLRNKHDNLAYELKELQKLVDKYEPLKEAMHYARVGVTHIVSTETGEVQYYEVKDRYNDKMYRMLSLRPAPRMFGKNVEWQINAWGDGSGSERNVLLCSSIEEAQEKAAAIITAKFAEALDLIKAIEVKAHSCKPHWLDEVLKNAKALGMEVPLALTAAIEQLEKAVLFKRIEKAQNDLQKLQDEVLGIEYPAEQPPSPAPAQEGLPM